MPRIQFFPIRRTSTLLLRLAWVSCLLSCRDGAPPPLVDLGQDPNAGGSILLITWDTVRHDHVGVALDPGNHTPTFDSLAAEGVRLMETRTLAPVTLPAHASLMTGRFPSVHGARDNGRYTIDAEVPTLAEHLAEHGYRTAAFVSAPVLNGDTGLARGFEHYDDEIEYGDAGHVVPERDGSETVDRAIRWLDSLPASDPVFMWVHLFDPHRPWSPDRREREVVPNDLYRAEIAYTDRQTGRLLDALDESRRIDNSLIVLTADHGEGLGEHGESTHAWFAYESTLRVPLVLWWGRDRDLDLERGQRIRGPGSLVDIVPTLAELASFSVDESDGVSLISGIRNGRLPPRSLPFESLSPALDYATAPLFGLTDGAGYVWIDTPHRELYDINVDPNQTRNLYTTENAELAEERFLQFERAWPPNRAAVTDGDTREQLAALGYLQDIAEAGDEPRPDPKDRIALYELLSVNDRQITQEEAVVEGRHLLEELGLLPGLVIFLVDRLDSLGRHREATELLAEASRTHPRFVEETRTRRQREQEQRALAQAIRHTLAEEPDHPSAAYDLAITLAWLEEWEESERLLSEYLRENPQDQDARINLSGLYGAMGQPRRAFDTLNLGRTGDYPPELDCLSARILYRYLDRPTEAVERLERCEERGGVLLPADLAVFATVP